MAQPPAGANLMQGNQQYVPRNNMPPQAMSNHQKNLTMNVGANPQIMGMLNSP